MSINPSTHTTSFSYTSFIPLPGRLLFREFNLETFVLVASSRVERRDDRFIVSSPGGKAFAQRMGWDDKDGTFGILKSLTKCVTGRSALEEQAQDQKRLVWEADVNDKRYQLADLVEWYSRLVRHFFSKYCLLACSRSRHNRCARDRVAVPEKPRFWYDRTKLLSQHGMTVHFSGDLGLKDFRSPTGTPKMNLDDLRRIIPLLRDKKLEFRLAQGRPADSDSSEDDL
ncbi:BQ5605_C017g08316 [Microbotryum silenes-dioicae]|uniref:BQ5605_C017g08316 protein n=1 Tax=Microbotryum silenes-dioicae TaxID=796604 RepID=A0A2X0LYD3_9BASI|nr:BQ5605_C017g08316 [Microbotryum silenes-dioicae]